MTKKKSNPIFPAYEFNNILAFAVCNGTCIVGIFPSSELAEEYISLFCFDAVQFFVRPCKITTRIVKPLKID